MYTSRKKEHQYEHYFLYNVGEKIIIKDNDDVEKGVIDKIIVINGIQCVDVKFIDGRKIQAAQNQILSQNETDIAIIPSKKKDFLE